MTAAFKTSLLSTFQPTDQINSLKIHGECHLSVVMNVSHESHSKYYRLKFKVSLNDFKVIWQQFPNDHHILILLRKGLWVNKNFYVIFATKYRLLNEPSWFPCFKKFISLWKFPAAVFWQEIIWNYLDSMWFVGKCSKRIECQNGKKIL